MMAKFSRDKGARGEKELFRLLSDHLGVEVVRNLGQYQKSGPDSFGLDGYAVEVKRCETVTPESWWRQALDQAEAVGAVPVLAYRKSRVPWRFRVPMDWLIGVPDAPWMSPGMWVETDLDGFIVAMTRDTAGRGAKTRRGV